MPMLLASERLPPTKIFLPSGFGLPNRSFSPDGARVAFTRVNCDQKAHVLRDLDLDSCDR